MGRPDASRSEETVLRGLSPMKWSKVTCEFLEGNKTWHNYPAVSRTQFGGSYRAEYFQATVRYEYDLRADLGMYLDE